MIDYHPIRTFSLGGLDIKVWGFIFALAVIAGLFWAYFRAEKTEKDQVLNITIITLIGGVIGSRLAFVILYPGSLNSIWEIFKIWEGGMVSYGGFILGGFLSLAYTKANKLSFYRYLDLFAPPLALSIAITRIGCFLNHDHLGKLANLPWAINYLGESRHPIALYYSLSALIIMVLLLLAEKRTKTTGMVGLSLVVLYPIFRIISDQFASYQPIHIGLINTVFLSIILIFGLYLKYRLNKKRT